ncbi:hypothetical protein K438DRAFT_192496 [Mycena galopus ATCC 62051]|nr:hypothetical protein K438DRAFT_192496 [Mycena galopus ATCC 62051]
MLRRSNKSQTVNVYGGRGGDGGSGSQGGPGGIGQGPTLNIEAAIVTNHRHGEAGLNLLHQAVALEALYDSVDSFPQPRCHLETRTKMLETLYTWAVQHNSPRPIHWLHGPAGAGKSAIMQTLCQKLQTAGRLGGAFFFKRGHTTRGNAKALFTTLAYQLALSNRDLNPAILKHVEHDPSAMGRSMDAQLRKLIVEPSQSLPNCPPLIFLIDGLDECQDEGTQGEIIHVIQSAIAVHQHSSTLRFLIASRPEAHIREIFEDLSFDGILDSMNVEQSFEDIRTYLLDEFSRIHCSHHTMVNVPTPWPSWDIVEAIVIKSSGYFIYASTVIKFIDDKYSRPTERLMVVQNLSPTISDTPFAALDQLYIQILSGVPTRFHSTLCNILQCSIVSNLRLPPIQLDQLFELESGDVQLILRRLHSVLNVPSDSTRLISGYHASFLDFLQDQQRSSIFHIDLKTRMNVARAVIKALSDDKPWADIADDHFRWRLTADHFMMYISSLPPSAELVPLIQQLNPELLWSDRFHAKVQNNSQESLIQQVLIWLETTSSCSFGIVFADFWSRRASSKSILYHLKCFVCSRPACLAHYCVH